MTFKFENKKVSVNGDKLTCDDPATKAILTPLFKMAVGAPQDGNPFINLIVSIYGKYSVTDVDDDAENLIY